MAQIGSLVVDLIAQTASFNSNIEKAARNLNSNAARMNRSVAAVQKQLGLLGSVAKGATTALAGYFSLDVARNALDYAGGLGEVAQQLGVTTRGLQVYRFAASQVGVSQEQIDNGLQRLTRTLGQVAAGAKGPTDALRALGFNTAEIARLSKMTADEAFPLLADRFARVETSADRAAVEVALFGKSGQQLDPLLKGGSKSINDFAVAAEKLGLVLSSSEIQQADDAADKLAAVKTVLEANVARTVAQNADSILKLANSFVALATGTAKFMAQNPDAIKAGLGALAGAKIGGLPGAAVGAVAGGSGGFDNFGAQVAGSKIVFEREGVLGVLTKSRQELIAAVTEDQRRLQAEFNRLNNMRLSLPEGSPARKSVAGAQAALGRQLGFGAGVPRGAASAEVPEIEVPEFLTGGGGAAVDVFGQSVSRLNEQLAATKLELQAVNENWPDSELDAARLKLQLYSEIDAAEVSAQRRVELKKYADTLVDANRQLDLARMAQDIATNSAERYAEAIQGLTDDVKGLADGLSDLPDLSIELPEGIFDELEADRDFAGAIGDSFGYAAEDALMHMDDIRGAAEALVSDLARIFIRRNVTLPIADAVSGWANQLMGNNVPTPDAGGFDAGSAMKAGDDVLTQLGAEGSAALSGLTNAAQAAGSALDASMVPAIGQAVTSTITTATTEGIAAGALQGLTASAISASAALSAMATQQTVSGLSSIAMASGAPGFATGGLPGGLIRGPGTGTSDSILARVSTQEFITNAAATRKNLPLLNHLNEGGTLAEYVKDNTPGFFLGGFLGGKLGAAGLIGNALGIKLPSLTPLGLIGDKLFKKPEKALGGALFGGDVDKAFGGFAGAMKDRVANDRGATFGDIHVHANGSMSPADARRTGRQIADEMRAQIAKTARG